MLLLINTGRSRGLMTFAGRSRDMMTSFHMRLNLTGYTNFSIGNRFRYQSSPNYVVFALFSINISIWQACHDFLLTFSQMKLLTRDYGIGG